MKKGRIVFYLVLLVVSTLAIVIWFMLEREVETRNTIVVNFFELNRSVMDRKLTIEDFDQVELGSSAWDIANLIGEPDDWIGSGLLRPVYFLEDGRVVICCFKSPAALDDLVKLELYSRSGECQIIKGDLDVFPQE